MFEGFRARHGVSFKLIQNNIKILTYNNIDIYEQITIITPDLQL